MKKPDKLGGNCKKSRKGSKIETSKKSKWQFLRIYSQIHFSDYFSPINKNKNNARYGTCVQILQNLKNRI